MSLKTAWIIGPRVNPDKFEGKLLNFYHIDCDKINVFIKHYLDIKIGGLRAYKKFKVSSDTIIGWEATLNFKLSKMKLFRASHSSVVHVEAVLTSNQSPV